MGKKNNVLNVYMNHPERIQSLIEYYTGEELPEGWVLACSDENTFFSLTGTDNKVSYRQRDIFKKVETAEGAYYLGIENQDYFSHIPKSAVDVLHVCMNIKELTRILEYHTSEMGEEETDMCKALEQIIAESREQGFERGIEQGIERERRLQIENIMDKLKLTTLQAMELLGIPVTEQSKYMEHV